MTTYHPHIKVKTETAITTTEVVTTPTIATTGTRDSWSHGSWKSKKMVLRETQHFSQYMWRMKPRLQELLVMLTYARPDGSETEREFIKTYLDTLPGVRFDGAGNRVVRVGAGRSPVCWASHLDTVHYEEGRQAVRINLDGHFALSRNSKASCLGADCTAGVWLMRQMILAGKSGTYIFHRGEECGGKGSKFLAKKGKTLWKDFKFMISLDRKGTDSIITDQFQGKTASGDFAKSIARMLPKGFKDDPTGSFTDSANYAGVVSECSNLSIGYERCHTERETLDFHFTDNLLQHLLALDYSRLVASRRPGDSGKRKYYYGDRSGGAWDGLEEESWNGRTHSQPIKPFPYAM